MLERRRLELPPKPFAACSIFTNPSTTPFHLFFSKDKISSNATCSKPNASENELFPLWAAASEIFDLLLPSVSFDKEKSFDPFAVSVGEPFTTSSFQRLLLK
jgi:hypothetical protein